MKYALTHFEDYVKRHPYFDGWLIATLRGETGAANATLAIIESDYNAQCEADGLRFEPEDGGGEWLTS